MEVEKKERLDWKESFSQASFELTNELLLCSLLGRPVLSDFNSHMRPGYNHHHHYNHHLLSVGQLLEVLKNVSTENNEL